MDKRKLILIDPGHGGIEPLNGQYTTAPNKMAYHANEEMHRDGWFYEGVWNRSFALELSAMLAEFGISSLFTIPFECWNDDLSLGQRIAYANLLNQTHDVLLISIHANSFNSKVRGWQVHTSPGETRSDTVAAMLYEAVERRLGKTIAMRSDTSDKDVDYENNFAVLTRTACTAILCENLFFDNTQDAKLLLDAGFCQDLAECYFSAIMQFMFWPA